MQKAQTLGSLYTPYGRIRAKQKKKKEEEEEEEKVRSF